MAQLKSFGRQVIYTGETEITRDNVVSVLAKALCTHLSNRQDIQYLYDYYKGNQPILQRVKEFRTDINNKIVENRANEIVSFKVGYLLGEPVVFVSRGSDETVAASVGLLNNYVFAEDKAEKDKELADWFTICGTAYRIILPNPDAKSANDTPFHIYTADPRNTFVVYTNDLEKKPLMGVYFVTQDTTTIFSVYTRNKHFEIVVPADINGTHILALDGGQVITTTTGGAKITKDEDHIVGDVPVVEYPADPSRLGAFEIVLPLLDALNTVSSNRLDGLEQFVDALLCIKGMDLPDNIMEKLREMGGLQIPADGDAFYLTQELNQSQTQTLVDYIHQTILDICGMPNRNGGSSTSDTGSAVYLRDGYGAAETRAKDTEMMYKMSENKSIRLMLSYIGAYEPARDFFADLRVSDIDIRFTRRNYENIVSKANVLTMMLANDKIAPELGFQYCNMFADPGLAYKMSMEYAAKKEQEDRADLAVFAAQQTAQCAQASEEDIEE